jgi:hypothetical protein
VYTLHTYCAWKLRAMYFNLEINAFICLVSVFRSLEINAFICLVSVFRSVTPRISVVTENSHLKSITVPSNGKASKFYEKIFESCMSGG